MYLLTAFVCTCLCVRTGLSQCTRVEVREQVQKSVPIYYSVGRRDQNWIIKLMANTFNCWAMSAAWEEVCKDKMWEDCIQYLKMRIVFTMIHSKMWHKPRVERIVAGQMSWSCYVCTDGSSLCAAAPDVTSISQTIRWKNHSHIASHACGHFCVRVVPSVSILILAAFPFLSQPEA